MKYLLLLAFLLFSFSCFTQENTENLLACGLIGEVDSKLQDCQSKNSTSHIYQALKTNQFKIQTVNLDQEIFIFDELTGLTWSPVFDRKKKCKNPIKKLESAIIKK